LTEENAENRPVSDGFDPIWESVSLMRDQRVATLATLERETGFPLATLVTTALDEDGVPLVLVSELSAHTRNLAADPRFSLLFARSGKEAQKGDPLNHPRVTLIGTARVSADPGARHRFVKQNPKAKLYADFADFKVLRLEPERVHLNGGFGKAHDGPAAPVLAALRETG